MNGALSLADPQDTVVFLESDLSNQEWTERQADELAIEMAGKDRLEKALIIGEKLSHIYNSGSFRRSAPGGERWTWEQYVANRLPQLLPEADGKSMDWADERRVFWEVRKVLSYRDTYPGGLPTKSQAQAKHLQALVPRRFARPDKWNPAVLDDPDAAEGIALVWGEACKKAETNQRKNGPTADDVRAAREELRPDLERKGLIRSAPASFQAAAAARVEAARQRTVDVTPANAARFKETMANIRDTKAERTAKVEVDHVREQLDAAEQQRRHTLEQEVRVYNAHLHATSKATHELLGYLQSLSRIHGTQLMDEMRCIDVLGLITVKDDMDRLKTIGTELMEAVNLARSSEPASGIHAETIEV
jgi:hypothetical protein